MSEVLDKTNFEKKVLRNPNLVMVDFFAHWCGPCQRIAPFFDDFTIDYKNRMKVYKVDIDKSPEIAEEYGVLSVPTVKFFKNGEEIDSILGAKSKEVFIKKIEELI